MAMLEPVTLEEVKAQCRIEDDSEDELIRHYIAAAREFCEDFLNITLAVDEESEEYPPEVKTKWKQAILLIAAHWYAQRENAASVNLSKIPLDAERLLWQDRDMPV